MALGNTDPAASGARPGGLIVPSLAIKPAGTPEIPENTILTSLDQVINWCRKYSLWPMPFATACCGIELMAVGASRFDIARFGTEVMRLAPASATS